MAYENCKPGAVQSQDGGWGFNVLSERAGPVVSLTYGTEAEAKAAHARMAKVIVGAAITPLMNASSGLSGGAPRPRG
jgi:hypothetical protein